MTINYKFRQMHDSYYIGNEVISCLIIKTEITLLSLTFLFHMGPAPQCFGFHGMFHVRAKALETSIENTKLI